MQPCKKDGKHGHYADNRENPREPAQNESDFFSVRALVCDLKPGAFHSPELCPLKGECSCSLNCEFCGHDTYVSHFVRHFKARGPEHAEVVRNVLAVALYALSLTVSATLLFLMEPMVAKMLLPMLGGSPAVWNSCVVFFQLTLLLGYLYAHLISTRLSLGKQLLVHSFVFALPLFVLPVGVAGHIAPEGNENPMLWLFGMLILTVGLPFFTLSTMSPLLQKWFAGLNCRSSVDPYFLFTASNFGSLTGLLCYPFLIEPAWGLTEQSRFWQIGYVALLVLTDACAYMRFSFGAKPQVSEPSEESPAAPITSERRFKWMLFTALPSSFVLGLTTFATSHMASIPMVWVIPLAVYLLTIMLAFARLPSWVCRFLERVMPWLVVANFILVSASTVGRGIHHILLGLPFQLLTLFVVSLVLHRRVADDRPESKYLTEYYMFFSLGGVLGSMINALLAPVLLDSPLEYPLLLAAIAVISMMRPLRSGSWRIDKFLPIWALPVLIAIVTCFLFSDSSRDFFLGMQPHLPVKLFDQGWRVIVPLAVALLMARTRVQLGATLAALFLIATVVGHHDALNVHRSRNFFGVLTARVDRERNCLSLFHDTTMHGEQIIDPDLRFEPCAYYARGGPAGRVLTAMFGEMDMPGREAKLDTPPAPYAMVGLGAGASSAYAHRGQRLDLYEINPDVVRISSDPFYFTHLYSAYKRGVKLNFSIGDARIKMKEAPDHCYKLIMLDAFSGDTPPFHLLTRESLALYRQKLAPGGVIAFHCSAKYYDIVSVVWNLVTDARMHALTCYGEQSDVYKAESMWMLVSEDRSTLEKLKLSETWLWQPLQTISDQRVWTDDYSNPVAFIRHNNQQNVGFVEVFRRPDGSLGSRFVRK